MLPKALGNQASTHVAQNFHLHIQIDSSLYYERRLPLKNTGKSFAYQETEASESKAQEKRALYKASFRTFHITTDEKNKLVKDS